MLVEVGAGRFSAVELTLLLKSAQLALWEFHFHTSFPYVGWTNGGVVINDGQCWGSGGIDRMQHIGSGTFLMALAKAMSGLVSIFQYTEMNEWGYLGRKGALHQLRRTSLPGRCHLGLRSCIPSQCASCWSCRCIEQRPECLALSLVLAWLVEACTQSQLLCLGHWWRSTQCRHHLGIDWWVPRGCLHWLMLPGRNTYCRCGQ